jgi:hypothetical protein
MLAPPTSHRLTKATREAQGFGCSLNSLCLPFAKLWNWRDVIVIRAVSGTLRHHTGWAAWATVASTLQALQARDSGVERLALFAQLSQYVSQIHGCMLPKNGPGHCS